MNPHDATEQAYKSPIEILKETIIKETDDNIYKAVLDVGINVDEIELIKALEYDRQQFKKGYELGYKVAKDEMVRCKDCKHQRNWQSMCYCTIWKTVHGMGEDGFCGYGERKED